MRSILSSPPHSLKLAIFSTDDLYLPHTGLVALAQAHPSNAMLQGRGLPGSHDLALGSATLASLARGEPTRIPRFDKSKFSGEGDRAPEGEWELVDGPVDVVLLEGWNLGFRPLETSVLVRKYAIAMAEETIRGGEDAEGDEEMTEVDEEPRTFLKHDLESLSLINDLLHGYVKEWYGAFDAFIQVRSISSAIAPQV